MFLNCAFVVFAKIHLFAERQKALRRFAIKMANSLPVVLNLKNGITILQQIDLVAHAVFIEKEVNEKHTPQMAKFKKRSD